MNTIAVTTYQGPDHDSNHELEYLRHAAPVAVQILSMIFFVAFAIVSTVLAFNWFWPAGFALAVIFALRGFGPFQGDVWSMRPRANKNAPVEPLSGAQVVMPSSGNASFDAYRSDMLARLETEHRSFHEFLARLRDARDKTEFDRFMDDRARKSGAGSADPDQDIAA